jgi:AraC family transcriptional regulator, alkane utilization regulator
MSDRPRRTKWQAPGHDAVMSVLDALRVRGHVYCRTEMAAPWGIDFPRMPRAHFHVIEHGPCWLRIDGSRHTVALASGDLVLLPRGSGHSLGDTPRARTVGIRELAGPDHTQYSHAVIRGGGSGAETRFVCGQFSFEEALRHPLIAQLPPLIHIKGRSGQSQPWLKRTLQFLADETRETRPGTATIVSRLTDIIFVQALRAWMDDGPSAAIPWLRAIRDRRIGVALDRIHQAPERPWTIASLAAEAGMSRSSFAARFKTLVGEPPLTYLTRWRMLTASTWLRTSDVSVAAIADRIGYQSEAAFTKAFKRQFAMSPAVFRRRTSQ